MSTRIEHRTVISEHSGDEMRIARQAGYFLPVPQDPTYPAFMAFFDFIDKFKLFSDDRILILVLKDVLDQTREIALSSSTESEWLKKRDAHSEVLSDANFELVTENDHTDAIAQRFPFLKNFEDKKYEGRNTSTHEFALTAMRDFFGALTYKRSFDNPTGDGINAIRERHKEWCSKFDDSNIGFYFEPDARRDGPYTRFNPSLGIQ